MDMVTFHEVKSALENFYTKDDVYNKKQIELLVKSMIKNSIPMQMVSGATTWGTILGDPNKQLDLKNIITEETGSITSTVWGATSGYGASAAGYTKTYTNNTTGNVTATLIADITILNTVVGAGATSTFAQGVIASNVLSKNGTYYTYAGVEIKETVSGSKTSNQQLSHNVKLTPGQSVTFTIYGQSFTDTNITSHTITSATGGVQFLVTRY